MGEGQAVAVIPYSTKENPVDLNGDVDVSFARENEVREQFFRNYLGFRILHGCEAKKSRHQVKPNHMNLKIAS